MRIGVIGAAGIVGARGQGRSHAVRLAQEGASIIASDICDQIGTVPYPMSTREDLEGTVAAVKDAGGDILARPADVRDLASLEDLVAEGFERFGRLDIVVANAGTVNGAAKIWDFNEEQFRDQIDVNLTGVWKTVKAAVPRMIAQNQGGSIILTSSVSGLAPEPNVGHYSVSKFGVSGLMVNLAAELAPYWIRVNSVNPTSVHTKMIDNPYLLELFTGGKKGATLDDAREPLAGINALDVPYVEPIDISNAVLYLASDESRYVHGTSLVVDAGALIPFKVR